MQQLSLLLPQLLSPAPLVWQLGGVAAAEQALLAQSVVPVHATGLAHWPHPSHVCVPLLEFEHCVAFGAHTGADAQEQPPHAQLEPHVCIP